LEEGNRVKEEIIDIGSEAKRKGKGQGKARL
jgi:hypothetical protein